MFFIYLHCTVRMTIQGVTVDHSINQIPLFWDSLLKHISQPEVSPKYHSKQEVCSYYRTEEANGPKSWLNRPWSVYLG